MRAQPQAGETRKGLHAEFGVQFDTHRRGACFARVSAGQLFAHLVEGDLKSACLMPLGENPFGIVFCFFPFAVERQ